MASSPAAGPDDGGLPSEIDPSKPHPARVYDYLLGGKDNFAADRETAKKALQALPSLRTGARENRAFLGRAVRYLAAEEGITQFLDLGSGLPTVGNVHEVAQGVEPSARVVYVDNDPIVLTHARALLTSALAGKCAFIRADIRNPEVILSHPATRETLDFGSPVGLIMAAVLPFITDEDEPAKIVEILVGALPSGSYVVATHPTTEYRPAEAVSVGRVYEQGGIPVQLRDARELADLVFKGLTLVPPGVVVISEWRPEPGEIPPSVTEVSINGGVARKP
jgi:S-adenosyl methyltransferase